MKMMLLMT